MTPHNMTMLIFIMLLAVCFCLTLAVRTDLKKLKKRR